MSYRIGMITGVLAVFACGQGQPTVKSSEPEVSEKPAGPQPVWSVVPNSIRYDGETQTVFVQVGVTVDNNGAPPRATEAYIGVTLAAEDGEEYDLAIQTVFPNQLDQPLLFSAGVEKPIQDVLVGLWDHKVQPCDSERPGCKTYGFLLDGSLASWPPNLYVDFKRQRILPAQVSFQWFGPQDERLASQEDVGGFLRKKLGVFGSTLNQVAPTEGDASPKVSNEGPVVLFKHPKDEILAQELSVVMAGKSKNGALPVERSESLATDFAVRVPGSMGE